MTEHELQIEVQKFYNGALTLDKCIKLYELEYEITPDIEGNKAVSVNISILPKNSKHITEDNLIFMKILQESGSVNMFSSINVISNALFLSFKDAKELLQFYMKHYRTIYYPERIIK